MIVDSYSGTALATEIQNFSVSCIGFSLAIYLDVIGCYLLNIPYEGLSRRKPYVTFHFVIFKIPSFARVIGFSFIPNIRTIDNKVEEKETKRRQKIWPNKFFWEG